MVTGCLRTTKVAIFALCDKKSISVKFEKYGTQSFYDLDNRLVKVQWLCFWKLDVRFFWSRLYLLLSINFHFFRSSFGSYSSCHHLLFGRFCRMHSTNCRRRRCHQSDVQQTCRRWRHEQNVTWPGWTVHQGKKGLLPTSLDAKIDMYLHFFVKKNRTCKTDLLGLRTYKGSSFLHRNRQTDSSSIYRRFSCRCRVSLS